MQALGLHTLTSEKHCAGPHLPITGASQHPAAQAQPRPGTSQGRTGTQVLAPQPSMRKSGSGNNPPVTQT